MVEGATYRDLFVHREFRALFAAHCVSLLGTVLAELALTVLVFAKTGSPALSALTFTVGFLPYLFGGALLGGVVDRLPARRVLVSCDLVSAGLVAVVALPGMPVWALLAVSFGAGLVAPVFGGTRAALLPRVLGEGALYVLGRATMRMVSQSAQVVGFGLGGLLIAVAGARATLLVDAGSFVLSAVLLRAGLRPHGVVAPAGTSLVRDSLTSLGEVLAHRQLRRLLLLRWSLPTCLVAPEALGVAYVHAHGGSARALGLYLAAIPTGTVAADLVTARFLRPSVQQRLVVPGALACVVPLLVFALAPSLTAALPLLLLAGLGSCATPALDRLVLQAAPAHLQARALGVDQAGLMFLQGLGFGVWGALAEGLPLHWTVAAAGALGLVAVVALRPGWDSGGVEAERGRRC